MTTDVLRIGATRPDIKKLRKAAECIKKGGIVAFPTETVYGLGASWKNREAVRRIYEIKNRPASKPLTVHIAEIEELYARDCSLSLFTQKLMERYWPGPLTIIVATDKGEKIGFRMPAGNIAREFIRCCGLSLVAPSANISGAKPPRSAEEVLAVFDGLIDMVIDGGVAERGIESTVVDASVYPYTIVREGAIARSEIADLGRRIAQSLSESPE